MHRRKFGKALGAIVITIIAFTSTLWLGVSEAQQNAIHIEGRVEWIAGNVMVIAPYGLVIAPGGTGAINIDLSHVDQTEYSGLVAGDPVAVVGTVTSSRGRVLAMSVQRLSS